MDKALLARVEKQAWFHKYPRGLPLLLFVVTIAATALGMMAIERSDADARRLELEKDATEIASALERRASENIAYLNAAAAIFSTRDEVSATSFANFADELNSGHATRGALGMGWVKWLDGKAVPALEASMHERGMLDYHVNPRPGPGTGIVAPIIYLEPLSPANMSALGFDMYSETVRRAAMDKAVQRGGPTVSGKVHLVQDKHNPGIAGFLIYTPVFADETREMKGFVYSPIRASEFLDSAIELVRSQRADIAIYDGSKSPQNLLAQRILPGRNGETLNRPIHIGSRQWILSVADKQRDALTALSLLTLLFGLTLALLLMAISRLITRRAAEDRMVLEWLTRQSAIRTSLTRELNHRVKNTLANVISIVSLTRRRCDDIDDFVDSLVGRIRALSATHDLLSQSEWSNARIDEIVRSELAPYMEEIDNHVEIAGPAISLAPNDALSLGLAIHELATNAAKYGALSTPEGKVYISWHLMTPDLAEFNWREAGGPPVTVPDRRGFGMDLVEKIVAHELHTTVDLRFEPDGVRCKLQVPVRSRASEFTLRNPIPLRQP